MKHGKYPFIISFLALPVLLYAWLVVMPFAQTFQISLTDWSGISPTFEYVGFENYVNMWQDSRGMIIPGFLHTGILLLALPIIVIVMALFFAFMLNVGGRGGSGKITGVAGAKFYKVVYFFPQVLSLAIIAIVWRQVYNPPTAGGVLASILEFFGLPFPVNGFINNKEFVLWAILLVMVWSAVGFYLVYFSAAMAAIPNELYEAAVIDGASRTKTFFKITLPLLWESVQTAWVYLGIIALDGFVLVHTMTPDQGGPNHSSEVIGGVIYKYAFGASPNAGMASAIGVLLFLFMMLMTLVFLRATRRDRVEM